MEKTLAVVNQMVAEGVIRNYAIGGAVGATFYLEPVSTFDIDIFISFPNIPPGSIISLGAIYNYLLPRGYAAVAEHIVIEGWQVQFLPAPDALYEEAVNQALETDLQGVPIRVMKAEHLMAIALQTGRAKDFHRIDDFIAQEAYDVRELDRVLVKFELLEKWAKFQRNRRGGNE